MSKTAPINMRVEPSQQALLNKAASILNKDRTAFILDVACREAENVILDQRLYELDKEAFIAFELTLNADLPENNKLKALLEDPSPWEQ